jgi:very-short-patch-repair endonuclease
MRDALDALARRGGIAHLASLVADGVVANDLRKLTEAGVLLRPRRSWYALPSADPLMIRAVSLGGVLTGVTALQRAGVWCVDDGRLHLAVPEHIGHGPAGTAGVCIHYSVTTAHTDGPPIASVVDALVAQFGCQNGENIVVTLDSALNKRLIRTWELADIRSRVPKKYWPLLDCVDPTCESGLETKVRLRLGKRGMRYRTQVHIPGAGRVDLLVGDRLIIETDGLEFHTGDAATRDRERDLVLHRLGYIVIRVTYAMVMYRWDAVEAVINAYVGRREHLWALRHRRAGLAH